ncbi:MAG: hypothetical protein KA488_02655 [Flavobacterium sp.]|jgi:hypothetical protein|nr:hypothetical protein [Flavobacterium sp.]MBP6099508.1 hypothetical protein [Flavobacterium sp.]
MHVTQTKSATKCTQNESLVCFPNKNPLIPLAIINTIFRIASKKTERTSKFGVQGPDLNFPETFIATIINIDIT